MTAGKVLAMLLLTALPALAQPDPALAEPARWRVAVAPFVATLSGANQGRRLADRLARLLPNASRAMQPLDPTALDRLLERQAQDGVAPVLLAQARACLAGQLDASTTAAARQVLQVNFLIIGGLSLDQSFATVELWDLRSVVLLGRWPVPGGSFGGMLAGLGETAGWLAAAWPLEAYLEPAGPADRPTYLSGNRFEFDLGQRHGVKSTYTVWLLGSLRRDERGGYADVVGMGRIHTVWSAKSRGLLEVVLPGADPASARFAVAVPPPPPPPVDVVVIR